MTQRTPLEDIDTPLDSPLVIPVESFGDSSSTANRSELETPRSNELSVQQSSHSGSEQLQPDDSENIHL